jgi:hypothetical protein
MGASGATNEPPDTVCHHVPFLSSRGPVAAIAPVVKYALSVGQHFGLRAFMETLGEGQGTDTIYVYKYTYSFAIL